MSDKNQKFIELAEKRVNRAIKDLRLIGNLSNKNNYAYTDTQVQKVLSTLEQELKMLKAKFSTRSESTGSIFKL